MKKILLILIFVMAVSQVCFATTYYLSPLGGNWSDASTWASTSGGSDSVGVPDSTIDVVADPNSGSAVLTVNVSSYCKSLNMTGFTGTLAGNAGLNVYGDTNLSNLASNTFTGGIYLWGNPSVFTSNNAVLSTNIFVHTNSSVMLFDDLNIGIKELRITQSTLISNNNNISCGYLNGSINGTKTITLGSSTVTCTSLDLSGTNLTFNYDTSTVIVNQSSTGAMSFNPGTCQFYNLTLNGYTDKVSTLSLANDLTVNNQLSLQGNSITNRLWIKSNTTGTPRTITAKTVDLDNVDFQDCTFTGDATWSGVSIGNCGGNSGTVTYTTPVTRYFRASFNRSWSEGWASTSGGSPSASVPLCHDTVIFDANSITTTGLIINCNMPRMGKDINFTGVANSPALSFSQDSYVFGSLTLDPNMTLSGTARNLYFEGRSDCSLTSEGLTIPHSLYFNNYGATMTLQDSLLLSNYFNLISGTFSANNKNVTANKFKIYGSIARNLTMGSGIWTVTGEGELNASRAWNGSSITGLSITPNTSTIIFNSVSTTNKEFCHSPTGFTYYNLKFSGINGYLFISNSHTFNTLESDTTAGANIISLTTGTTQTLTKLFANTEPSKKLTLQSTTSTPAILTSSQDQFIRYTDVSYVNATGTGNYYYDPNTCTVSNSTGDFYKEFQHFQYCTQYI